MNNENRVNHEDDKQFMSDGDDDSPDDCSDMDPTASNFIIDDDNEKAQLRMHLSETRSLVAELTSHLEAIREQHEHLKWSHEQLSAAYKVAEQRAKISEEQRAMSEAESQRLFARWQSQVDKQAEQLREYHDQLTAQAIQSRQPSKTQLSDDETKAIIHELEQQIEHYRKSYNQEKRTRTLLETTAARKEESLQSSLKSEVERRTMLQEAHIQRQAVIQNVIDEQAKALDQLRAIERENSELRLIRKQLAEEVEDVRLRLEGVVIERDQYKLQAARDKKADQGIIDVLQKEKQVLQRQCSEMDNKRKKALDKQNEAETRSEQQLAHMQDLQIQLNSTKEQLNKRLAEQSRDQNIARQQHDETRTRMRGELELLQRQLEEAEKERIVRVELDKEIERRHMTDIKMAVEVEAEKRRSAETDRTRLEERLCEVESQTSARQAALTEEIASLRQEIETLRSTLRSSRHEQHVLEEQISSMQTTHDHQRSELDRARRENGEIKQHNASMSKEHREGQKSLVEATGEMERLHERIKLLERELDGASNEYTREHKSSQGELAKSKERLKAVKQYASIQKQKQTELSKDKEKYKKLSKALQTRVERLIRELAQVKTQLTGDHDQDDIFHMKTVAPVKVVEYGARTAETSIHDILQAEVESQQELAEMIERLHA